MATKFNIGDRLYTPRGRTVEVVGVEVIDVEGFSAHEAQKVEVVAFHILGAHYIYIRKASDLADWPGLPEEV